MEFLTIPVLFFFLTSLCNFLQVDFLVVKKSYFPEMPGD